MKTVPTVTGGVLRAIRVQRLCLALGARGVDLAADTAQEEPATISGQPKKHVCRSI